MNSPNPYEAPRAALDDPQADESGFLGEPRRVSIGAGGDWLGAGFRYFSANPGMWIVLLILFVLVVGVPQIVPFGSLAVSVFTPALMAGIYLACDEQRRSGSLEVGRLFAGFSRNTGQLMVLGAINLVVTLVSMLVMYGGMYGAAEALPATVTILGGGQPPLPTGFTFGRMFGAWAMLMLVMVPISMAMWFAPALVAINGTTTLDALRLSFFACARSFPAVFVYVLMVIALAIAASIPLMLGWFVAAPVLLAATYAAYRDFFYGQP